jgi:hypothetical protein
MTDTLLIPVSPGELLDKISILRLKREAIDDDDARRYVERELDLLEAVRQTLPARPELEALCAELLSVNQALWRIEDNLRAKEAAGVFDDSFVEQARQVYIHNDRRAAIKRDINELLGSSLREQKRYTRY